MDFRKLMIMFDEFGSGISSNLAKICEEFNNLIAPFESLTDAMNELNMLFDDFPLISPSKKKLKFKQPLYKTNYIQPQIKSLKYLPYQRRVY